MPRQGQPESLGVAPAWRQRAIRARAQPGRWPAGGPNRQAACGGKSRAWRQASVADRTVNPLVELQVQRAFRGAVQRDVVQGRVRLVSPQRATVWKLDDRLRVQQSGSLVADLTALLGPSCVSA